MENINNLVLDAAEFNLAFANDEIIDLDLLIAIIDQLSDYIDDGYELIEIGEATPKDLYTSIKNFSENKGDAVTALSIASKIFYENRK